MLCQLWHANHQNVINYILKTPNLTFFGKVPLYISNWIFICLFLFPVLKLQYLCVFQKYYLNDLHHLMYQSRQRIHCHASHQFTEPYLQQPPSFVICSKSVHFHYFSFYMTKCCFKRIWVNIFESIADSFILMIMIVWFKSSESKFSVVLMVESYNIEISTPGYVYQ
jgi:hypothetical protein